MKNTIIAVALLGAAGVAQAESPHAFSANVALTTDYMYRGVSQTNEDPAISGGFDYAYEPFGFYAGVWASSLEFNAEGNMDDAGIEIDYYGGFAGEFSNGISWDVGGLYYHYPSNDEDSGADYDFWEFYGSLSYTFDVALEPTIGIGMAYSPDFYGEDDTGLYGSATLDLSLPHGFGLSFLYGYQDVEGDKSSGPNGFHYDHFVVGLNKDVGPFNMDLSYYEGLHQADADINEGLVFTVSAAWDF
jgi:uncharacterized protein (TIGR02001 family)